MNYKIVETSPELPDVLLYRDINDAGTNIVVIYCSGYQNDDVEDLFFSHVIFENIQACQRFIRDYSTESAIEWCMEDNLSANPVKS